MRLKTFFLLPCLYFLSSDMCFSEERQGIINISINLNTPEKVQSAKLWIPYPLSDDYQSIEDIKIKGDFDNSAVYKEPVSGVLFLFAEWPTEAREKTLEFNFKVKAQEKKFQDLLDTGEPIPVEIKQYLQPDEWIPMGGEVAKIADSVKRDKTGILEKARAVYDWVVENTHRDPNVKGCGTGIVERTLAKRSGKCADLSSVYVALARNIGVPSREVFGLRLGKTDNQDITGGYHCWAEFYLPGTGWIPVDPSDVRKKMLAENLKLSDVNELREYYFGSVDAYRIVLERGGRWIKLPYSQESTPVNYLMYPYAEINGKAVDYFDPQNFRYSVHFKQIGN